MNILKLYFLDGPLRGSAYALDSPLSVGRYRDNDVVVPDQYVSRHHARFVPESGKLVLQDLGSKNGTYVNERKVLMAVVEAGDVVRFGKIRARIEEEGGEPVPLSAEEERALSRPPSEPLRGEWHVDEGFASCRNIEERNRDAAGVFSRAEHPEFGEVTLFAYYPGLCANDDFRRLAVYEAKRREGRRVDGVPPLLSSGMERGLLYLLYEREAGERVADLADSVGAERVFDMLLAGAGVLLDLSSAGLHHGGISPETVFAGSAGLFTFSAFGVVRPDRLERFRKGRLSVWDVSDLCGTALFALSGGKVREVSSVSELMASGLLRDPTGEGVPEGLLLLAAKGAAREGQVRYRSLGDFHRDLLALKRGEGEELAAAIRAEAEAELRSGPSRGET